MLINGGFGVTGVPRGKHIIITAVGGVRGCALILRAVSPQRMKGRAQVSIRCCPAHLGRNEIPELHVPVNNTDSIPHVHAIPPKNGFLYLRRIRACVNFCGSISQYRVDDLILGSVDVILDSAWNPLEGDCLQRPCVVWALQAIPLQESDTSVNLLPPNQFSR